MHSHPNNNARETRVGIWIFQGPGSLIALIGGVMAFVAIYRVLSVWDVDLWLNLLLSAIPLLVVTALIWAVRDKPKSYAQDMILLVVWKCKTAAFMNGLREKAPLLWVDSGTVRHPKEF